MLVSAATFDLSLTVRAIEYPHTLLKAREEVRLAPQLTSLLRHSARTARNARVCVAPGRRYAGFLVVGLNAHPE
jgi:hypothetical protein